MDQDLPFLDETVVKLPQDLRESLALKLQNDLYSFSKFVLGYHDMTVRAHGPMCTFLDHNPSLIKACGMPRNTFKSSIGTIARTMQRVVKNPDDTHLIANESATNAQRFLGTIKQHAESNAVFRALWSSVIPKDTRSTVWNNESLRFNRDGVRPEPTVDAIGMTGTYTSRHYDHVNFDDIISEEASKSEKVMRDVTDRARKVRTLFRHPDRSSLTIMFTRWLYGDTYEILFGLFKGNIAKMIRGAIEDDGPIFPEFLSLETLAQIREELGEYAFSCMYMNSPRNEEVQDFNVQDLRWWKWYDSAQRWVSLLRPDGAEFRRYHIAQLDITTTVDLASAEKLSDDRNAVTTCGVTPEGEILVLESWARRCSPIELIKQLISTNIRWQPRAFGIEDVAYQKAFKHFLQDYAAQSDEPIYFNVKPIKAIKAKETRIRGLQPFAAVHKLYLSPEQHILRNEMAAFPLGQHDDALDCLSMQLQLFTGTVSARQQRRMIEREKEALQMIHVQQASLAGIRIEDPDNDIDYRPAFYSSYELEAAST